MRLIHLLASFLWLAGMVTLLVGRATGASANVALTGLGLVLAGFLLSLFLRLKYRRLTHPLSQEGFPVWPSGVPVGSDTQLEVGARVLAFSQDRWWRATIVEVEAGDRYRVSYPGWDPWWVETHTRDSLQLDVAGNHEAPSAHAAE